MKKRFYFYVLLALACLILIWLLFQFNVKRQGGSSNSKRSNEPTVENVATVKRLGSDGSLPIASTNKTQLSYAERLQQALEMKNVPIDFYGRVIDQNSNTLSGVKINVTVRHWELSGNAMSRMIRLEKETDTEGRFEINGITGDAFDIESIQKEGYQIEPTKLGFSSSSGNFENPVIFKMWSNNVRESLITGSKFFKVVSDGRSYIIDLIKGTATDSPNSEGDLVAWIKRSEPKVGRKYDWSFNVQANDGGFSEEFDQYDAMYLAPENGYTNTFSGEFFATDQHWNNAIGGKRFYIKTRNGQVYGRIKIEVYPSYGNTGEGRFWIQYAINPTGSRNLEPAN